jgi:hypothetical protein
MDTENYVHQVLKEHLLTKDYIQLTPQEASNKMKDLTDFLKDLIKSHQNNLSRAEFLYFQRSFQQQFKLPVFYGLPKVHKNPVTLRPVVSTTNSLLAVFSVWLDYKMKELLPFIQSCIKNSSAVINNLKQLEIPDNALLFTADATSMYTNIDTKTGISAIRDLLDNNNMTIPTTFPTDLFLQILTAIMENNIFSFANTYWLQLARTAMGTPAACNYATITFGNHENMEILPNFTRQLLYYRRCIDDVFAIWIPLPAPQMLPRLPLSALPHTLVVQQLSFHLLQHSFQVPFATSAGGGGDERVASVATALGFFVFSIMETADAKGADCCFCFEA